jgi:hypothetical protein
MVNLATSQHLLAENKFKIPTEAERLQEYFWQLEKIMPNPPRDWAKSTKECKWLKILKEKELKSSGAGRQ